MLKELLNRIKENCAGSNRELTQDQLDDIQDSLFHFAKRFEELEEACVNASTVEEPLIDAEYRKKFESLFEE